MKYIALDFETSGLDFNRHAPVSLGVALFEDGNVISERAWTFAPPKKDGKITREYDVVALSVSGTSWKAINEGTPISVVMAELTEWVREHDARDLPVVAFNAPFDFQWYSTCLFLGGSWNQHTRSFETFRPPLAGPWYCARLVASVQTSLPRYNLDTVAEAFGLARSGTDHGALEDAIIAGKVYWEMTGKAVAP